MKNSSAILLLVICFSIRDIKLTQPRMKSIQNTNSHCNPQKQNSTVVHSRKRRYLIFEKGSTVSMTGSSVKTVVATMPQGLNLLCEVTIYYELPSTLTIPKIEIPKSTKSPITRRILIPNSLSRYNPYFIRVHKRNVDSIDTSTERISDGNIEGLFFQQLQRFAKTYGYNGQHCIMRTICEAQHFLYPKGQSLFHDIVRIVLEFSLPTIKKNKKYFTASKIVNPMDCANLYGPHCRISFLDYFTVQIHGKFM